MSAPHLYAESVDADRIVIEGDDAHHAIRVMRLRPGERVTVSDGVGTVAEGAVSEASRTLVVDVTSRRIEPRRHPILTVVQGIPKTGKLDLVVQKLTEIGVDELVPFRAARSVARWQGSEKVARLRVVAREAGKQSHRAWLLRISDPIGIEDVPLESRTTFVLHEEATSGLLAALPEQAPDRIVLVVGPEGGLAPHEVDVLSNAGTVVGLGSQILRTETAALVAATLIFGHYGRIG